MAIEIRSEDLLSFEQLKHHVKIYAGPGAGKTHFIVENVKNIVKTDSKIKESKQRKVLCITYTNAAVDEIKSRLEDYSESVDVYTIHGFIIEYIIKPYQTELKKHMLNDFGIKIAIKGRITSQIEGLGILHGHDKEKIFGYINDESNTDDDLSYSKKKMGDVQIDIDKFCNDSTTSIKTPDKIDGKHKIAIKKYAWAIAKKLTHDEILYFGYRIVSNSTIAYALRVQFPYIFVDEFQDTNPLQAMLIKEIGSESTIIGIIGDMAQSIYSFQGAKPSKFEDFNIDEKTDTYEYKISGNRRSTKNIVSLCNYIRKSDGLKQVGIKPYKDNKLKEQAEKKKVCFVVGETLQANKKINEIITAGGVILTRTWAAAFNYMDGVTDEQKTILKKVYNSYYASPIDLRAEIAEYNNVTWVRAFKFILRLFDTFNTKSVADVLEALKLYIDVNNLVKKSVFTANILNQMNLLLEELFNTLSDTTVTVKVIDDFNRLLKTEKYTNLFNVLSEGSEDENGLSVSYFDELDRDNLITSVSKLEWRTSYILFKNVFSNDSKYMTVHQAKGLEWKKVVVSLEPTKKEKQDKITFSNMFNNPKITDETAQDEFTRLFYVACSRAEEELYINLKNEMQEVETMKVKLEEYAKKNDLSNFFEFI